MIGWRVRRHRQDMAAAGVVYAAMGAWLRSSDICRLIGMRVTIYGALERLETAGLVEKSLMGPPGHQYPVYRWVL